MNKNCPLLQKHAGLVWNEDKYRMPSIKNEYEDKINNENTEKIPQNKYIYKQKFGQRTFEKHPLLQSHVQKMSCLTQTGTETGLYNEYKHVRTRRPKWFGRVCFIDITAKISKQKWIKSKSFVVL